MMFDNEGLSSQLEALVRKRRLQLDESSSEMQPVIQEMARGHCFNRSTTKLGMRSGVWIFQFK